MKEVTVMSASEKSSPALYKFTLQVEILAGKMFAENERGSGEKPQCLWMEST